MNSYWNEAEKERKYPKLVQDISADVAIIGGGLTGIQTAYLLANRGLKVALLEKDKLCSGTSGGSTGKITSQHGLFYEYLVNSKGVEFAKRYLEANEEAINNIENIVTKENIECDFERESAYVFTQSEDDVQKLIKEQSTVEQISKGKSNLVDTIEMPLKIKLALM